MGSRLCILSAGTWAAGGLRGEGTAAGTIQSHEMAPFPARLCPICLVQDCRLPFDIALPAALPGCPMLGCITEDPFTEDPREAGCAGLAFVDLDVFVVLLADALCLYLSGRDPGRARWVVHELELQIRGQMDEAEWDALDGADPEANAETEELGLATDGGRYCGLTKQELVYAVHALGVKLSRLGFRCPTRLTGAHRTVRAAQRGHCLVVGLARSAARTRQPLHVVAVEVRP